MPCAYLIAAVDVTDPVQYEHYKKLSSIAMQAHGAQVCVRGGRIEVLEGDWTPASLAIHTQAVLQGAFILAKATGDGAVARDSVDHLARYLELLFQSDGLATRSHHDTTEPPR